MPDVERNMPNRMAARIKAVVLLFAIAFATACGSVCHLNSCDAFQTADRVTQDSGCHHQLGLSGRQPATLSAKPARCGVRELILALPTQRRILASVAKNVGSNDEDFSTA